jgi:hypothetical protein
MTFRIHSRSLSLQPSLDLMRDITNLAVNATISTSDKTSMAITSPSMLVLLSVRVHVLTTFQMSHQSL